MRRDFTNAVKRAAFERAGGCCEGTLPDGSHCGAKLFPGRWTADHDKPDFMGGEPTLENARCLCDPCDARKYETDRAMIDKTKRLIERDIGLKKRTKGRPFPGARSSNIKMKINGGPVDRRSGEPLGRRG